MGRSEKEGQMRPEEGAPLMMKTLPLPALPSPGKPGLKAKTMPASSLDPELLRKTRPRRPKPAPPVGKVEAWATQQMGKASSSGGFDAIASPVPSPSKSISRGGRWADKHAQLSASFDLGHSSGGAVGLQGGSPTKSMTPDGRGSKGSSSSAVRRLYESADTEHHPFPTTESDMIPTTDGNLFRGRNGTVGASGGGSGGGGRGVPRARSLPRLPLDAEEKRSQMPKGSILERDSPRARSTLRSFLRNFMETDGSTIKKDIDLARHAIMSGTPVTNAWIQEICVMQTSLRSLNLENARAVGDAGLWAIARHCTGIQRLNLSGCHQITKTGLRSVALRCLELRALNFDHCTAIDDQALRTLASGCWELQSLSLSGCANLSDLGVAEIARVCRNLTYLNISGCSKIGEFGDTALTELGKNCPKLKKLDMYGCSNVGDQGIIGVAQGCPDLETFRLTGCKEVTGKAVGALAAHCSQLTDLSLAGCVKISNSDLGELASHCTGLAELDLSDCSRISGPGLEALVGRCASLRVLNLERCRRLNDDACEALANAHQLETLNLGGCPSVSERGLEAMAVQCTGLANLNLTGCTQISRRFLMHLISDLEFSEPATEWYGYKPKPDVDALRHAKRQHLLREQHVVVIQRYMRGALGRRRAWEVYRQHLIRKVLVDIQARVRGVLQRRRWRWDGQERRERRGATMLAAWWRGCVDRERVAVMYDEIEHRELCEAVVVQVQRAWRGMVDRRFVTLVREEVYAQRLEEAKEQARLELGAKLVQGVWRKRVARRRVQDLRVLKVAREARARREDAAVREIQRLYRGHVGRKAFAVVKANFDFDVLCWHESIKIQAGFRGMLGRRQAAYLRLLRQQELERAMATRIQNVWRQHRAKYMTAMARSLRALRKMEGAAATEVQRMWRGRLGWYRAQRRRLLLEELRTREKAALDIGRVYRGHKGREVWEVAFQLKRVEEMARPLYAREEELVQEKKKLAEDAQRLKNALEAARKDTDDLREELEAMLTVTHKYWDTARITGTPQRFLTEYLKVRMAEQLAEKEATIAQDKDRYNELVVKARQRERMLRQVRRELEPLTRGMAVKTKRDRIVRLRNRVRLEKWASTTIQRHFRGYRLRQALFSWYRDYWVEMHDDTTGDTYFYNSWSEEVRWTRPLEMTLLPHKAVPPPDMWREDFDEERGVPIYINDSNGETTYERPPELDYE